MVMTIHSLKPGVNPDTYCLVDPLFPIFEKGAKFGPLGPKKEFYIIQDCFGKGNLAAVFKCVKPETPEALLAIKINKIFIADTTVTKRYHNRSSQFAALLEREERIFKRTSNCPYVVSLIESGSSKFLLQHSGRYYPLHYLVLEPLGTNLNEKRKQEPLPIRRVCLFLQQMLKALSFLHTTSKVTHADIKPDNVALEYGCDDRIKLYDFNNSIEDIEKIVTPLKNRTSRWYRAPEYFLKQFPLSTAIDIWSTACTIIAIVTGSSLFKSKKFADHAATCVRFLGAFPADMLKKTRHYTKAFVRKDDEFNLKKPEVFNPTALQESLAPFFEEEAALLTLVCDLLRKMLAYDPEKRITAEEALAHPLFEAL